MPPVLIKSRNLIVIFLILSISGTWAAEKDSRSGDLPEMIIEMLEYTGDTSISIDSISKLSLDHYKTFDGDTLLPNQSYWYKIVIDNQLANKENYLLSFNSIIDELSLYQKNDSGKWNIGISGILVPEKKKTTKGYIEDKIAFTISTGPQTTLFLTFKCKTAKYIRPSRVSIKDADSYYEDYCQMKLIQSFFLGIIAILCVLNFLLFLLTRIRIYLYYMLYAFFASIYFLHHFRYFESGFLLDIPQINIYFFFSLTIIQVVYSWFLYESLKNEAAPNIVKNIRLYAISISVLAILIITTAIFNFERGVLFNDIYSALNSISIFVIILLLFRKVSITVQIILLGTLFLILGATSALILNINNDFPMHAYVFQGGFLIELLCFTIAINFMSQRERLAKVNVELKNASLLNEKLVKEREAQKLREQLHRKKRDLTTKAFAISQKETLIKNVSSQLNRQIQNNTVKIKDIKDVISDLNSKVQPNYWQEFETYFTEVHPDFYKHLNEKYPGLTTNERRLCAFLKLNLTTKEIAAITKRNPESIHMTRSRLRKKMGLNKNDNLENVIVSIN